MVTNAVSDRVGKRALDVCEDDLDPRFSPDVTLRYVRKYGGVIRLDVKRHVCRTRVCVKERHSKTVGYEYSLESNSPTRTFFVNQSLARYIEISVLVIHCRGNALSEIYCMQIGSDTTLLRRAFKHGQQLVWSYLLHVRVWHDFYSFWVLGLLLLLLPHFLATIDHS